MNSVTQIAIGTLVLGAAFFFGNQLRNQTPGSDMPEVSTETESEFVWQQPQYQPKPEPSDLNAGLIEMPEAKKRIPSMPEQAGLKLSIPSLKNAGNPSLPVVQEKRSQVTSENRTTVFKKAIVEPDFSQLASSFFEVDQKETLSKGHGSETIAPLPRLRPTTPDVTALPVPLNSQTKNKIADKHNIAPRKSLFDTNDFEPKFKTPNANNPVSIGESKPGTSYLAQVEGLDNATKDNFNGAMNSPAIAKRIPITPANDRAPNVDISNEIRMAVPSGMTDQAKSQLVEVSSRHTNGLRLDTNRFIRHRATRGETLQQVSQKFYGTPDYYLDIYLANQDVLLNPGRVPVGTSLRIPIYD